MKTDADYQQQLDAHDVPRHLHAGLVRYFVDHIRTGDFLHAVLRADWHEAAARADACSLAGLPALRAFLLEACPFDAWGSSEKVAAWRQQRTQLLKVARMRRRR